MAEKIFVARVHEIPASVDLEPRFESRTYKSEVDLTAVRGIVVATMDRRVAAFRVIQDLMRQAGKDSSGHASTYYEPDDGEIGLYASDHAKTLINRYAAQNNGIVGHIAKVVGPFEQCEQYGPDELQALDTVRVEEGSTPLHFDELAEMFGGPDLASLTDPLSQPKIEEDIRTFLASGALALREA